MALLRIHKSSYMVSLLIVGFLTLIVVPGEIVSPLGGNFGGGYTAKYEHGWPWVYLKRSYYYDFSSNEKHWPDMPKWGVPWLALDSWQFWEFNEKFKRSDFNRLHAGLLCADLTVLSLITFVAVALWERVLRRRKSIFQVSLSCLLAIMTFAAITLAWGKFLQQEYESEKSHITRLENAPDTITLSECSAPNWLKRLVGTSELEPQLLPQFFWRTTWAQLSRSGIQDIDTIKVHLLALKKLNTIAICTDTDYLQNLCYNLAMIPQFQCLDMSACEFVIDKQLAEQLASISQLKEIRVATKSHITLNATNFLHDTLPDCKILFVFETSH